MLLLKCAFGVHPNAKRPFGKAAFPGFLSSVVRKAREILTRSVSEGDPFSRVEGVPSLTLFEVAHFRIFLLRCAECPRNPNPKRQRGRHVPTVRKCSLAYASG